MDVFAYVSVRLHHSQTSVLRGRFPKDVYPVQLMRLEFTTKSRRGLLAGNIAAKTAIPATAHPATAIPFQPQILSLDLRHLSSSIRRDKMRSWTSSLFLAIVVLRSSASNSWSFIWLSRLEYTSQFCQEPASIDWSLSRSESNDFGNLCETEFSIDSHHDYLLEVWRQLCHNAPDVTWCICPCSRS